MSRKSPKSHSHHLSSEQRNYQLKIKEARENFQEKLAMNEVKLEDKEKEPKLEGITSDLDLRLFHEAQAVASEKIVSKFYHKNYINCFYIRELSLSNKIMFSSFSLRIEIHEAPLIFLKSHA